LKEWCKKWVFQKECGEVSGFVHYQGRFSLKAKQRKHTLLSRMPWPEISISPTSCGNKDNDFYVTKLDTRVDGPWKDSDKVVFLPDHLKVDNWHPWQKVVIDSLPNKAGRHVNMVVDKTGNHGKSTLVGNLECNHLAVDIPFCNDHRDIMRMVMNQEKLGCYFVDMPRAVGKDKLRQLFAGIESIKNGYAYDDRYHFKKEYFQQPHVWVFSNCDPDISFLSVDRWKLWSINERMELVKYVDPNLEAKIAEQHAGALACSAEFYAQSAAERLLLNVDLVAVGLSSPVKPNVVQAIVMPEAALSPVGVPFVSSVTSSVTHLDRLSGCPTF
jgi:hypothetical protein